MNYNFFINNGCVFCNRCLFICPTHTIQKDIKGIYFILDYGCIDCFKCFYVCPVNAIEFYKIKSNIKINKYVLKDKICIKKVLNTTIFNNYFKI